MKRLVLIALPLTLALISAKAPADPLLPLLAGEFSLQSGDNARAAGHYFDASLVSEDAALAERATRIALLAGDTVLAERALVRWRQLDPDARGLLQVEASLGLARSDAEAAAVALASLLTSGEEGVRLALQALASDQHVLPSGLAIRALVNNDAVPADPDIWVGLGLIARRHQQTALSLDLAQRAVEQFPQEVRMRLWLAEEQLRLGSQDAAREQLETALAMGDLDPPVRMSAAALLERLGESGRAAQLLAEGPQDDNVLGTRAALLAREDGSAALSALYAEARVLEEKPSASRRLLLGQLAELAERDADALDWYRGVDQEPQRARAILRVAVLLDRKGALDQAQQSLRDLQLDAEADGEAVRDAYLLEAELMLRRQRDGEALAAYQRGLEVFEDDPRVLYGRALVLERMDRVDEALSDLTRLVEQDPDNPDHLNALGYTLVDRTDRVEEGLAMVERALEMRPESAAVIDSRGWALFRLGRLEESLAELRRAFELQPDPEIAAHLGEVLWKMEQPDAALAAWQQGLEIDPDNSLLKRTMQRLAE